MKIIKPTTIPLTGQLTRASIAYYTDSNGVITQAAVNELRFNYNAGNLAEGPLALIEPAATNQILFSSGFDDASWFKQSVTITANTTTAPDNTNTGDTLRAAAGSGFHALSFLGADQTGQWTFSVYAKAGTTDWIRCGFTDIATAADITAFFNLTTGTIGTVSAQGTAKIEKCLNGWYRCSVTGSATTAHFPYIEPHTADNQIVNWTATGNETVSIWQAQYETGSVATSPIYSTGTAGTRAADFVTGAMLSNVPENDYPLWNSGTTYAVGDTVLDLTTHKIFSSSVAGNLNHPPPNTNYWVDLGYDNRWRMFDQSVNSQTSRAGSVSVAILPGARFDSIVGLNVSASSVQIKVNDPVSGIVYSKSFPMTSYSGVNDWYEYFYTPVERLTDFYIEDIPPVYSNSTITITFTSAGTAAVGALIIGLSKTLGVSEWGTKVGIIDYSVKTVDAFGNYTIVPRNFSKRNDYTIQVPTDSVDSVYATLASYRTTPIVYIGSNSTATQKFTSTIVYGFYKDFSINISYPAFSVCTMQVEGLT